MGAIEFSELSIARFERRKLAKQLSKRLGPLEFEERHDLLVKHPWASRVAASGKYWLQEKVEANGWRRAMLGRHDKKPGMTWPELQRIKTALYGDRWAVQCYPPENEVTDEANIYWLFVAPLDWKPVWK